MNEFILALLKCKRIGNAKAYEFLKKNRFDLNSMKSNLAKIIDGEELSNFNKYLEESIAEIEKNKSLGINIITIADDRFPSKLFNISDPIIYLYYKGNIELLNTKSIAVIGTRHPRQEYAKVTMEVAKIIVDNNYTIIGGLALGIDTIGHQIAVNNKGKTIAVLPTGLDNIQPASNRLLANSILNNNGCLLSEYSVGTSLNNFNYAKRDRIQSALSNAIFVGEAAEKSGTMITVSKAMKENIPVFQLEGNNNSLIKNVIKMNCENIDSLFKSADDNYNNIHRKELINNCSNEQISLF